MKIAFALLVLTFCTSISEATLKHLKAKLKISPFVQPSARYKYLVSSVILPEPVVYSSPVSTFTAHTSTYYAPTYALYTSTYSGPAVYSSAVSVPVAIYRKPLTVYEEPQVIRYEEPATISLEASATREHLIEGHYFTYGNIWDK